ncbi:hypothetical protein ACVLD2_001335 [Paenibacillus sp. PvR052]
MNALTEHEIYPIARIVIFKDTVLANKRPDLSFVHQDGSVWGNSKHTPESFVNPYKKEYAEKAGATSGMEAGRAALDSGFHRGLDSRSYPVRVDGNRGTNPRAQGPRH